MKCFRRVRLVVLSVGLSTTGLLPLAAQTSQQQTPPAQQQQQTPPPQTPPAQPPSKQQQTPPAQPPAQPANPFETVPQTQQQTPPTRPPAGQTPLQAPTTPNQLPAAANGEVIEGIDFRGARRVPQDTLKAIISEKVGDIYSPDAMRRDFTTLYNQGRFDDIRVETEQGKTGIIIHWILVERRVIRSIDYTGLHSVTVSDILDRFKERKVGLSVESQYDPDKVQRAVVALKEFLSERGHQYATVEPRIEQIPPSSLKITFAVNEGPKVKVGNIEIEGNKAETSHWVIEAMKNLKPYGIPHSIFFESLIAKTYDQEKLEDDKEHIREAYQNRGYFEVKILDETVKITPKSGSGWRLPLLLTRSPGIYADIKLPVEEGRQYHLNNVTFVGIKLFREPSVLIPYFGMHAADQASGRQGDVFSREKLTKGLENLRKVYGQFGYIDFVPEPSFDVIPNSNKIDLTITADEGKQFFIRRIDFSGNTTTRDKVIRREILLDEGDMFNTQLWDYSILRLNQLGYFEMLKKEDAAEIRRNPQTNTVDITLKVKERGKNSIGLNGGVSGIAGTFVGFNYSTNNFLGLGETLSLQSQLGTRMRNVSLGFTEPYFMDRPLQLGFVVYINRFDFNQAREASILAGTNLIPLYNSLGAQNLLNYTQNSHGASISASYPLRRSFARLGVTYGYDISNIVTLTSAATNYFQYINFSGVAGPNALNGIHTSHITGSYSFNTVNHPISPTGGHSIFFSVDFAGSALGGNVNTIRPTIEYKGFRPSPFNHKHILALHALTSLITGYGGKYIPPFSRTFMGGEMDIRGFENWGISPVAFIPTSAAVSVYNSDGTPRMQNVVSGGAVTSQPVTMNIPSYQFITPGGDTHVVINAEYRIPIIGPITLAPFIDAGVDRILLSKELSIDPSRLMQLNQLFPSAGFTGQVQIAPGTQKPRTSTGLELQVMLPVVNAPFRVYMAYNPTTVREYLQPPIVADRAFFPNAATYNNAIAAYGQAYSWFEKRDMFRFTIGRTF